MRKTGLYGMMSAAALMMAGCQADESLDKLKGQVPIYLTASVIESQGPMVTRAGVDVQSTQLPADATFLAEFTGSDVTVSSATYTANGSGGATTTTQPYFKLSGSSTTVHAYAPSKPSGDAFSVAADQSTDAAYQASDLMYATATVTKASPVGALTFTHKMAKIIVNATLGDGISSITAVKIVGGYPTCALSGTDCTVGDPSGTAFSASNPLTVFSGTHSEGTLSCAALIPPQTVTSSDFLVITADGSDVTYNLDSKTFATGQSYTFNITVNAAAIGTTIAITNWANNGSATVNPTVELTNAPANAVAVDLGLSVKWANMNVGATAVTDYGTYFAWGETSGYTVVGASDTAASGNVKTYFSWDTYAWCKGTYNTLTKYCPTDKQGSYWWDTSGTTVAADNKTQLELGDDAAHANWGGKWRMPTQTEMQELVDGTDQEWATINSVAGRKFMKKSDHSVYIFLPAASRRDGASFDTPGSLGLYWSSTLYSGSPYSEWFLGFDSGSASMAGNSFRRFNGFTVRAVQSN